MNELERCDFFIQIMDATIKQEEKLTAPELAGKIEEFDDEIELKR